MAIAVDSQYESGVGLVAPFSDVISAFALTLYSWGLRYRNKLWKFVFIPQKRVQMRRSPDHGEVEVIQLVRVAVEQIVAVSVPQIMAILGRCSFVAWSHRLRK